MTVSSSNWRIREMDAVIILFFLHHSIWVYAAPSIESCPEDSVQIGDTCKCNVQSCSKPPCSFKLEISTNATDSPGSCCPIYVCTGCPNNTLIEGKCPCAPNAILNAKGECICIDPYKKLIENECVCDTNLCALPQICDINSVSVSNKEGCCWKNRCIRCPDDSFPTNNDNEAIEDKCVCYPCSTECGPNESVIIMARGKGLPGSCCDLYRCEIDSTKKKCIVGNTVYLEGDTWKSVDLETCKCQDGITFCLSAKETFHSCHEKDGVYKHNEWWMLDSCTNCTCDNGDKKCISHLCDLSQGVMNTTMCEPLNCTKSCSNGYKEERGCKTCKCDYDIQQILDQFNITEDRLKDIIDDYFSRNSTELPSFVSSTTMSATSDNSSRPQITPSLSDTDMWHLVMWPISAVIICVVALCIWLAKKYKNHGSYDTASDSTAYERVKLQHHTFFNNNCCIGNNNKNKQENSTADLICK